MVPAWLGGTGSAVPGTSSCWGAGTTPLWWLLPDSAPAASGLCGQTCPAQRTAGWGWARGWERAQLEELSQADQRDVPYCTMSCSAIKAVRKEEGKGYLLLWHLSIQPVTAQAPLS